MTKPALNTCRILPNFTHTLSLLHSTTAHECSSSTTMIRTPCAWAARGLRRTRDFYPRNPISGNNHIAISPSHILRRPHASKPPIGQKAPESASTIPGPTWLWLEPIYEPFRAYGRVQQRKPYMTQFISSLVIYFVGDLVAQSIAEPVEQAQTLEEGEKLGWVQEWSNNRDWSRTGRSLIIGGLSSIPAYKWFLWLGNNFNYSSKILSLSTKVQSSLFFPRFPAHLSMEPS